MLHKELRACAQQKDADVVDRGCVAQVEDCVCLVYLQRIGLGPDTGAVVGQQLGGARSPVECLSGLD